MTVITDRECYVRVINSNTHNMIQKHPCPQSSDERNRTPSGGKRFYLSLFFRLSTTAHTIFHIQTHASHIINRFDSLLPSLDIISIQISRTYLCRINNPFKTNSLINPFLNHCNHIYHVRHFHMHIFFVIPHILRT